MILSLSMYVWFCYILIVFSFWCLCYALSVQYSIYDASVLDVCFRARFIVMCRSRCFMMYVPDVCLCFFVLDFVVILLFSIYFVFLRWLYFMIGSCSISFWFLCSRFMLLFVRSRFLFGTFRFTFLLHILYDYVIYVLPFCSRFV